MRSLAYCELSSTVSSASRETAHVPGGAGGAGVFMRRVARR